MTRQLLTFLSFVLIQSSVAHEQSTLEPCSSGACSSTSSKGVPRAEHARAYAPALLESARAAKTRVNLPTKTPYLFFYRYCFDGLSALCWQLGSMLKVSHFSMVCFPLDGMRKVFLLECARASWQLVCNTMWETMRSLYAMLCEQNTLDYIDKKTISG